MNPRAIVLVLMSVVLGFVGWWFWQVWQIDSFDECEQAGYEILESYPRMCKTPDGRSFGEELGGIDASVPAQEISVVGTTICLPHKGDGEVETLECAYGVRTDEEKNYALSDPDWQYLMDIHVGKRVAVRGLLREDAASRYDIVGVIEIGQLEML